MTSWPAIKVCAVLVLFGFATLTLFGVSCRDNFLPGTPWNAQMFDIENPSLEFPMFPTQKGPICSTSRLSAALSSRHPLKRPCEPTTPGSPGKATSQQNCVVPESILADG